MYINKTASQLRAIILNSNVNSCGQSFWKRQLGVDVSTRFDLAYRSTSESRLRLLHFKICHNIWPTNISLNWMNIVKSENCEFCNIPDYLEHYFIDCRQLNGFWSNVFRLINSYTDYSFQNNNINVLFGIHQTDKNSISRNDLKIANSIILIGKMCISKMRFGPVKDIRMVFYMEWGIRKNSVINT